MKIACIGNYNHMLFSVTRYLRDQGYEIHLYYFPKTEPEHFRPHADSYLSDEDLDKFVFKLDSLHFFSPQYTRYYRHKFAKYDLLFGSDWAPSMAERIGRKLDIFIPHGFDIQVRHSYKFRKLIPEIWEITLKAASYYQKRGIEKSSLIIFDETDKNWEAKMKPLRLKRGQRVKTSVPMVYTPQYQTEQFAEYCRGSTIYNDLRKLKDDGFTIVFSHSRHEWTNGGGKGLGFKGNDILIRGYADFVKKDKRKSKLICFEYGSDVEASRVLINELGIDDHVIWYPQMNRKEIMPGVSQADIVAGQFMFGFNTFGVILEGMTFKKPILNYRDDDQYRSLYDELYPLMNASTAKGISRMLVDYMERPDYYEKMGLQSYEWMVKYVIRAPLETCLDHIKRSLKTRI